MTDLYSNHMKAQSRVSGRRIEAFRESSFSPVNDSSACGRGEDAGRNREPAQVLASARAFTLKDGQDAATHAAAERGRAEPLPNALSERDMLFEPSIPVERDWSWLGTLAVALFILTAFSLVAWAVVLGTAVTP